MTPNLGKASLVTGITPDDRLLSCSAIVLHNNQTGATGLYHFSAGNIQEDKDAQQILTRMRDEVAPTEGYIVYGTEDFSLLAQGKKSIVPSDTHSEKTRSYVSGLLPEGARLRRIPATLGVVSVSQSDHNLKIEQRHPQGPIVQTSQLQPHESYFTV